jgi:acetylornithine deacetylase
MSKESATEIATLLSQLVRVPSVNPHLDPDSEGEAKLADFCCGWLERRGVRCTLEESSPGRPNLIAEVGTAAGATVVLCGHLDTVAVDGMRRPPFEGAVEDGRLYGRGAYDMKGGVAAIMLALARLADAEVRGRVVAALVADEEYASEGAFAFVRRHSADACILTEPSALELVLAHKGFVWLEVETHGIAAHGSRWDLGSSAIAAMAPIVVALSTFDSAVLRSRTHPLCGPASLHCAQIEGGDGISTYAAHCTLRVERRTIPGERTADVVAELVRLVHDASPDAEVRTLLTREPMTCAADAPLAMCVRRAAEAVLGRTPRDVGVAYWMDAAIFSAAGIPTVNIGGSGEGAHAALEWADVASHDALARILAEAALAFLETCGVPGAV